MKALQNDAMLFYYFKEFIHQSIESYHDMYSVYVLNASSNAFFLQV